MSNTSHQYDIAIVGGGLAGLATSILLARKAYRVMLFEKETYPFHKVCGEYISLESWNFLLSLGLPLQAWQLPEINTLNISSPNGRSITQKLPLGGFGISRYLLDNELSRLARASGVDIWENCRVQDIIFNDHYHTIITDKHSINTTLCCGAFGKRSNLDVKWKRPFTLNKASGLNNYIGIKYHATIEHPEELIALHHFKNGYCGISRIEDNKCCICYLTTANNLRDHGNSIEKLEKDLLAKNPLLKQFFARATILYEKPLTISQISFEKKEQVENHVLMLGDAAGLITPLCGNGMSMALHSGKLAAELMDRFLQKAISRQEMENSYRQQWKKRFSKRLLAGRIIQSAFGKEWTANLLIRVLKPFPLLINKIIVQTHGEQSF